MFCPQCGKPSGPGAQFCASCGASIAQAASPVARVRPPAVTILAILHFLAAAAWTVVGLILISATSGSPSDAVMKPFGVLLFVLAASSLLCGYGLWKLKPFGRYLQIAYSIVGLLGFPVVTLISILVLIHMFSGGVRVLFSHRPIGSLTPQETAELRALERSSTAAWVVGIIAAAVVMVGGMGVMAAIAIPNLLTAVDRGKQKRTMADMRSIAVAIESYGAEKNAYPAATDATTLKSMLEPKYIPVMPTADGWGRPFLIDASVSDYTILSAGKDGTGNSCDPAVIENFNDEICFTAGEFVRHP